MIDVLHHFLIMSLQVSSTIYLPLPLYPLLQSTENPFDLVTFFQSIGALGVLVFFVWAFLIKEPPLFVTWREHKEAQDLVKELNAQLKALTRGVEKTADKLPEKRTASSYRVSARRRGNGES